MTQAPWTTRRLLEWTTRAFEKQSIDSPRVSAEMLLAHVLNVKRLRLFMEADRPASDLERSAFRALVERALKHEPVDYLVSLAPFFAMHLKVDRRVLIPRPSTETLVEHVLQHQRRTPGFATPVAADIGTGSGAIAIALAKQWQQAKVDAKIIATDLHQDALDLAAENAKAQGVADLIDFRQGNLLEPIRGDRLAYLLSNPPYIPDNEWPDVAPNVKDFEPHHALRGGPDGLEFIRPLLQQATRVLEDPGQIAFEIATATADAVIQLAHKNGLKDAAVLPDHEKLPRVLVANR